jgi:hypothetical protein
MRTNEDGLRMQTRRLLEPSPLHHGELEDLIHQENLGSLKRDLGIFLARQPSSLAKTGANHS